MSDDECFLGELTLSEAEAESRARAECGACLRPVTACWCGHLPRPRLVTNTRVIILQHPGEVRRNIRTCRMLELGLAEGCTRVVRGRKFPGKDPDLCAALSSPATCLLYPGGELLETCDPGTVDTLVILDGTWDQAKKIYNQNPAIQGLRKVTVNVTSPSEYIVRTQPSLDCLSTLEAAAHSLAALEARPEIVEPLVAPLVAMCNIQIRHGAVTHDSKDIKTIKLENSAYEKRKPQFRS